ncbi:MAG: dTMP kinase [Verrucomicrobiales bacterium]
MPRGLFITFEGSEGCGKSTQIELLRERLESAGHGLVIVREPGGTALGEEVRELLLHHHPARGRIAPECELLLFEASRAQLVRERIGPALAAGSHVIADRFYDSTTVYQGFGRGLDLIAISQMNAFAVGPHHPDLTILLDMEAGEALERARRRSGGSLDRMESESMDFFERVRTGYLHVAREAKHRIKVLDATAPPDSVADEIWGLVQARLPRS